MVDYNYVECTTSALSGLKQFTKIDPEYRRAEISYVPSPASFCYLVIDGKGDNNKSNRLDSFSTKTRWIMVRFMVCLSLEAGAEKEFDKGTTKEERLIKRGICFTYATMFALESLAIAGETHENSAAVRRACDFLVSKQMEDGGWGETYMVSILASTLLNLFLSQHIYPISSTLPSFHSPSSTPSHYRSYPCYRSYNCHRSYPR
jgi:lanosterol synthase